MSRFISRRKTTPKVRGGKVQRKNRSKPTPNYYNTPQSVPVLERQRPGPGYRHLIRKAHLVDFISILPDWDELSIGLNAVLLAPAEEDADGWHDEGIVAVCAWPRTMWTEWIPQYVRDHRRILRRLGVPCEKHGSEYTCRFTEATARAFQLLHVLLHELGHHHDRMTTRTRRHAARGEGYAEHYANQYADLIFERYVEVLGLD